MAKITVVKSESLSDKFGDRFIVVDEETGEILDDAQGYGYRSVKGAYAALAWKASGNLDKPRTAEDKKRERKQAKVRAKEKKRERIRNWLKIYEGDLRATIIIATREMLEKKKENDPKIDFTAGELMYVWKQNLIAAASGTIERKM